MHDFEPFRDRQNWLRGKHTQIICSAAPFDRRRAPAVRVRSTCMPADSVREVVWIVASSTAQACPLVALR